MKKIFLIALMAIFCGQGIWAQNEEINKVAVMEAPVSVEELATELQSLGLALQELQSSSKEEFNPNKPIYKPFYGDKKSAWYQEQSIVFAPMSSSPKDLDNNGLENYQVGGVDASLNDRFEEAADEADPDVGWGLNAGYVRTFIPGSVTENGWLCNRWGTAYNAGFILNYKRHGKLSAYSAYALVGAEFGHFHKYGIGINALAGFGDGVAYVYDLDKPDDAPEPDNKICWKTGGELWLRLGNSGAGLIPGVETRLFVRIIYAFDKNEYEKKDNTYHFSMEKSTNIGMAFCIPF